MKEDGDGAKTKKEQVKVKKEKLRSAILFFYIKDRNSGLSKMGLRKRQVKESLDGKYPEITELMHYYEDAFEILSPKKVGAPVYLRRHKGYSYVLNEEITDNIIQDYRLAEFFVKLVERFDEKSFSYKELKEKFSNDKNLEKSLEKLKKMKYIVDDSFYDDSYLIVLDRYYEEQYLLELIIKERIRQIR